MLYRVMYYYKYSIGRDKPLLCSGLEVVVVSGTVTSTMLLRTAIGINVPVGFLLLCQPNCRRALLLLKKVLNE